MKDSSTETPADNNHSCRRDYYRLDEEVMLGYRMVNAIEAEQLAEGVEPVTDSKQSGMVSRLASLRVEANVALNHLMARDPAAGRYFKTVEERLEILGEELLMGVSNGLPKEQAKVNLSASGMAFNADTHLPEHSWLEVEYQLPGSSINIHAFGYVVRCCQHPADSAEPGATYGVAVEMHHLSETDRDFIVSNMLERQAKQIRREREQRAGY